ncbi:hypothetical protein H1R20_g1211, partial [Candolleomyces eurysporus]
MPQHPLLTSNVEYVRLPAASCGYQAVNERKSCSGKRYTVEDLRREGFTEVKWDRVTSQVIIEENTDKIMIVMASQPDDPTYQKCQLRVTDKVLEVGKAAEFTAEELHHKRASESAALNHGIFHRVGTSGPVNLSNGKCTQLLEDLVKDPDICRMASFADASFKTWSPKVYEEIENKLEQLYDHSPSLSLPFECCVLPCAAFNFGPQGPLTQSKGGHLVIEELKLFIQFPPGANILIPSALVKHGNTPVGQGEVRLSFTVFCPGRLVRWVNNDFQTQEDLRKRVGKKKFEERMKLKETRWKEGLEKICTVQELVDRYTPKKEDASSLHCEVSAFAAAGPST